MSLLQFHGNPTEVWGHLGQRQKALLVTEKTIAGVLALIMLSGEQRISIISVPGASLSTGKLQISVDTTPHSGSIVGKERLRWGVCHFTAVSR